MQMLPPTVAAFQILKEARSERQQVRSRGAAIHAAGATKRSSSTMRQVAAMSRPSAGELRAAIDAAIPPSAYLDDVHGAPAYRRHLTYYYAEQIRRELAGEGESA